MLLVHSSNVVGDANEENNFLHKLLLTNTQVSRLCKAFANNSLANIKLSKTQLHKILIIFIKFSFSFCIRFLGRIFGPLLKTDLPLIGNVLKPLTKSVLIPLGLTVSSSSSNRCSYS